MIPSQAAAPAQQQTPPANLPAPAPSALPGPLGAVVSGELPAIRFPAESRTMSSSPLAAYVQGNLDGIARAGADFTVLPNKASVIFNPIKTSKEAIHKAYKDGKLDELAPEIKATAQAKPKALAKRTVHTSPAALAAGPADAPQGATNSAGAPAGPDAPPAPDGGNAPNPPAAPQNIVKTDSKLKGARISALKQESESGIKNPRTVVDKIAARPI
jgi:hypothetical protein